MSADHRETLAAELKRAFASAAAARSAITPPARKAAAVTSIDTPRSSRDGGSISFTQTLLRAVLAGRKTQTRRPIRPVPAMARDGARVDAEGRAVEPLYTAGDRLWVREKWARVPGDDGERFVYAIDEPGLRVRWMSSRFMPRAAARTFLRVERVDVARVGAIDDADAAAEGVDPSAMFGARTAFLSLWDSIYGDGDFRFANDPWVWVVRFALDRRN